MKRQPTSLATAIAKIDGSFVPDATAAKALQVLEEAMSASFWTRTSTPEGIKYAEIPDHAIRMTAAVRLLEWKHGKPTQPLQIPAPSGNQGTGIDLGKLLGQADNAKAALAVMENFIAVMKIAQATQVHEVNGVSAPQPPESESAASPSEARPSV